MSSGKRTSGQAHPQGPPGIEQRAEPDPDFRWKDLYLENRGDRKIIERENKGKRRGLEESRPGQRHQQAAEQMPTGDRHVAVEMVRFELLPGAPNPEASDGPEHQSQQPRCSRQRTKADWQQKGGKAEPAVGHDKRGERQRRDG